MIAPAGRMLGLFAGGGDFPRHLLEALTKAGHAVCVVGFRGETDPRLLRRAAKSFCGSVGEYGKMIDFLRAAGVREALMAGYVRHTHIYRKPRMDSLTSRIFSGLLDRRADTLLTAAALRLKAAGITLVSAMPYLKSLIPERGALTKRAPTPEEWRDIEFGRGMARQIAGLDIGQTVCVRDLAVVAVEAGRTILLDRPEVVRRADRAGISLVAV